MFPLKSFKFQSILRSIHVVGTHTLAPYVAVIGSGPAGFYTTQQLLKKINVNVDMFEKQPVPYGLVRYGVAPDHPEVKNVINTFSQLAEHPRFHFFGNVEVGKDILLENLRKCYTAVVLAYGSSEDKMLCIPGESLQNVLPASSVIKWYNGFPGFEDLEVNLEARSCIILGHGNVAVDIARILLSPISLLEKTDITSAALEKLSKSRIEKVYIVGRRGPLHAAFTPAEFREIIKLPGCKPVFKAYDFIDIKDKLHDIPRSRKRLAELQIKTALEKPSKEEKARWQNATKELHFIYKRSPIKFLPDETNINSVGGVQFVVNVIENNKAISTHEMETLAAHLVIKSVGFYGQKIEDDLPFDEHNKIIPNNYGRVIGLSDVYCSGWIKTGSTGVIANTMNSAFETSKCLIEDLQAGVFDGKLHVESVRNNLLNSIKSKYVKFSDWKKLDIAEINRGKAVGKCREKIVDVNEMLKIMKQ